MNDNTKNATEDFFQCDKCNKLIWGLDKCVCGEEDWATSSIPAFHGPVFSQFPTIVSDLEIYKKLDIIIQLLEQIIELNDHRK